MVTRIEVDRALTAMDLPVTNDTEWRCVQRGDFALYGTSARETAEAISYERLDAKERATVYQTRTLSGSMVIDRDDLDALEVRLVNALTELSKPVAGSVLRCADHIRNAAQIIVAMREKAK